MKNVAAFFSDEERSFIREYTGITLSDEKDYSDDELLQIHEAITDNAPMDAVFERIIDKFYDNFEI